jgi:Protein of unknown function (DUF4238)
VIAVESERTAHKRYQSPTSCATQNADVIVGRCRSPSAKSDMPLDHYVSQVHLKNFYSPALDGLMYAIRKSDLRKFNCNSQSVCRIEDNSTNAYLTKDRAIEEFLLGVEPKYNAAVAKLRDDKIDQECIQVIAGFVSYLTCCCPAAMRIHSGPMQKMVESTSAIIDAQGVLEKSPSSLGGKSLSELLKDGTVRVNVDPKYPQAVGISNIVERVSIFGNAEWEILHNDDPDSAFFTSDYPVAIERTNDPRVQSKLTPLTPKLAVRITPKLEMSRAEPDFSFTRFSRRQRQLKRQEILNANRLIVQCAEDTVFYRDDHKWIDKLVQKNRYHRIEAVTSQFPHGTGHMLLSTQKIVAKRPPAV